MTGKAPEPASDKAADTTGSTPPVAPAQPAAPAAPTSPATAPAAAPATPAPATAPAPAPAPVKAAPAPAAKAAAAPAPVKAPRPVKNAALKTQRSGGGSGAAVGLAILSLLVAVGAVGIGIYALDVARDATSRANALAGTDNPAPVVGAPAASTSAAPAPQPTPSQVAAFTPEFLRTQLKVPPPSSCLGVFVDVDQLQVGVQAGHEFYTSTCLGPISVRIDKVTSVVPTSDNPTPEVCAAQLAGTTQTSELVLQARVGLTFCLLTLKSDTTQPQRLAIVEVRELGADQSVTLAVSTYRVPNQ